MIKLMYHRLLVLSAVFGFIFYVAWNIFYFINGNIPQSILYKLTGIPSPTTGMYRSLIGIIKLDYNVFITNNPFVIPFLITLFCTVVFLASKYKKKQPLLITNNMGLSYFVILIFSEIWMLIK